MVFSRTKLLTAASSLAVFGPVLIGTMSEGAEAATRRRRRAAQQRDRGPDAGIEAYPDAAAPDIIEPSAFMT
jgi:hypothetical protein